MAHDAPKSSGGLVDKELVLQKMESGLDLIVSGHGFTLDRAHAYFFLAYFLHGAPKELRLSSEFTDSRLSQVGDLSHAWSTSMQAHAGLSKFFVDNHIVPIEGSADDLTEQTVEACQNYYDQFHQKVFEVMEDDLPLFGGNEHGTVSAVFAAHFMAKTLLMSATGRTSELMRRISAGDVAVLTESDVTEGFTHPVLMDDVPRIAGWSHTMYGDLSAGVCTVIFASIVDKDMQRIADQIYGDWDGQTSLTLNELLAVDLVKGSVVRNVPREISITAIEDPPIGEDERVLDASLVMHDAVMRIYSRIPAQLDVADEDEVKKALLNWGSAFVAVTTALTVPQVQALTEAQRLRPEYLVLMQTSMQLLMQFEQMLDSFATTIEGDDKAQWDFNFTRGLNNTLLSMAKEGGTPYESIASKCPLNGAVLTNVFAQEIDGLNPGLHLAVVINSLLVAMAATRLGDVPYPYVQGHEWELPRAKPFFSGDPDVNDVNDDGALSLAGFVSPLAEHANKVGVSTFISDMRNPASAMGVIQSISGGGYPIPPGHSVYGRPNLLGVPPTY